MRLDPDERLLVKSGANRYKVVGPGRVLLLPWGKALTTFDVGPRNQSFHFNNVHTQEDIPLGVMLRVAYQVNPGLFDHDLLPRIPALSDGGWQETLKWQVEAVLQRLLPGFAWRDLRQEEIRLQFEGRFVDTLAPRLKVVGLEITEVSLVKVDLPQEMQKDIIRAERDHIAARLRATTLKEYLEVFGEDELTKIMPYIAQWEMTEEFAPKP